METKPSKHNREIQGELDYGAISDDAGELESPKPSAEISNATKAETSDADYERAYPWPNLPKSVRPALEHCFNLDAYSYDSADAAEMARRYALTDIDRQQAYVKTYCGNELNAATLDAAALGAVKDAQSGLNPRNQARIRANDVLTDYVLARERIDKAGLRQRALQSILRDNQPSRETIYTIGLLQDRERLYELKQKCINPDGEDDIIPIDKQPKPRDAEWLENPTIADPDLLRETVDNVNVESILIAGAEAMQRLDDHATDNRATLNDIKFIERVLGPIAEVIGFDTMAQSMYDKTKQLRLKYGGKQYLVDYANAILDRVNKFNTSDSPDDNVKRIVESITQELFHLDHHVETSQPIACNKQNQAIYGYSNIFNLHIDGEDIPVSLRYRQKTAGSLAWKMLKEEREGKDVSKIPMDIVGMTVVLEGKDDQSIVDQRKVFKALVDGANTDSDESVNLKSAPSKSSPVHVAGTSDYVQQMKQSLTSIYDQPIDTKVASSSDGLHLGKITLMYHNIPCEVQCVTRHYRDLMQRGPIAHIIYKVQDSNKLTPEQINHLQSLLDKIHGRRKIMSDPGLVGSHYDNDPAKRTMGNSEIQARQSFENMLARTIDEKRYTGAVAIASANIASNR